MTANVSTTALLYFKFKSKMNRMPELMLKGTFERYQMGKNRNRNTSILTLYNMYTSFTRLYSSIRTIESSLPFFEDVPCINE